MTATATLREDQIADLAFMIANKRCLILHDPGTGKTPPVCLLAYWFWLEKQQKTAWAMPKSLLRKNRDELLRFTDFEPDDIVIIDGTRDQRAAQMRKDAKVYLMGFQRWSEDWETLTALHPTINMLLVDEIHLGYGGYNSVRSQRMFQSMHKVERFVGMTGTLINGRLDSAYPAIHVIEPRYYAGHTDFINQHAIVDYFGNIEGWRNHEKLSEIFRKHAIRRTFEMVYGKQEEVLQIEEVEMAPKQAEKYKEFEETALLELDDESWLDGSANPGVNMIRCRQILAHPECVKLPVLDGYDYKNKKPIYRMQEFDLVGKEPTGKDERLLIHLEDHARTGKPLVIFSALITEMERIERLCKKAGLRTGLINGNVPSPQRSVIDEKFRNGQIDVIVASPATAGIGFNWEHVDHIIFASMDYMASSYLQAKRRAIRGKRKTPLRITVLEYRGTIERRMFFIIEQKSRDANLVDSTQETVSLSGKAPKPKTETPRKPDGKFSLSMLKG